MDSNKFKVFIEDSKIAGIILKINAVLDPSFLTCKTKLMAASLFIFFPMTVKVRHPFCDLPPKVEELNLVGLPGNENQGLTFFTVLTKILG